MTVTVITMPELGWDCLIDVVLADKEEAKRQLTHEKREEFDYDVENGYIAIDEEFDEETMLEQYYFFQREV